MAAAVGRPLTAFLRRHEQRLALAAAALLVSATGVAPLVYLLLGETSAWSSAVAAFSRTALLVLLARSVGLSLLVTGVALVVGIPLGVLAARTDVRGRWPAVLLHAFPAFLPPFLIALGWFHVFGTTGAVGSPLTSRVLFSEAGLVVVLGLALTPIATALTMLGLAGVDATLEEAARVTAGPWRTVALISLPAAAPALSLAALAIFTLAFSELGVPMFLRVDTFPAAVFARLGGVDYAPGEALALVLPALPLALVLLVLERRLAGGRSFAVLGLRSGRQERIALGRWRTAASIGLWLVAFVSVAPLASLGRRALAGNGFSELGRWMGTAPWNSLAASAAAATIIVALALVAGHTAARRLPGGSALDAAAVLTFVLPAAVLGVGLIAVWNRPALQAVYGGLGMLVVGYVARYAVIGIRAVGALVAQTPPHLEEAAAAAGAGYGRRLVRILLPLHQRGIAAVWLLTLVFCLRDLELPVLYYPAGGEPLTVRIFTLEANGPQAVVAALALVQAAMTATALAAGGWLLRKGGA